MESVVWQCSGCRTSIDPEDEVIEFIEQRYNQPAQSYTQLWHYAHVGHEEVDTALGHKRGEQGKLRALRALHHPTQT